MENLEATANPTPTEGTPIDLFGDGKLRMLRYSFKVLRRLKKKLGQSMVGMGGGMMNLDEDLLPELIYAGLSGRNGEPPEDVTLEEIEEIPTTRLQYLVETFNTAFFGSMAKKKLSLDLEGAAQKSKPN